MITVKDEKGHSQVWPVTASTSFRAQRRIEEILRHLPVGAKVLELGCGHGDLTSALLSAGHRVTALDRSAQMLDQTLKNCGSNKSLEFVHMEVGPYLASTKHKFDAVVGMGILHHCFFEISEVSAGLNKLLVDGGQGLFWEPNRENPLVRFIFGTSVGRRLLNLEETEDAFTREFALNALKKHFSVVAVECRDWVYPFMPNLIQRTMVKFEERGLMSSFVAQSLFIRVEK